MTNPARFQTQTLLHLIPAELEQHVSKATLQSLKETRAAKAAAKMVISRGKKHPSTTPSNLMSCKTCRKSVQVFVRQDLEGGGSFFSLDR